MDSSTPSKQADPVLEAQLEYGQSPKFEVCRGTPSARFQNPPHARLLLSLAPEAAVGLCSDRTKWHRACCMPCCDPPRVTLSLNPLNPKLKTKSTILHLNCGWRKLAPPYIPCTPIITIAIHQSLQILRTFALLPNLFSTCLQSCCTARSHMSRVFWWLNLVRLYS